MSFPATGRLALRSLGCTLLFWALAPGMLHAQELAPPAPTPSMSSSKRDAAVLTLSASTAADDNGSPDEAVDVRDPQFRDVHIYSVFGAAVVINPQQERFHWQINAATGVRHYESLHEFIPTGQTVNGSLSFSLGGRTNISVSETATYSPTYSLAPLLAGAPGTADLPSAALDYGVVRSPNYSTTTSLSVTRALTSRAAVSVAYTSSRMLFTDPGEPDLISGNASARFTYRVTKYAGFHVGYGRRIGQYDLNSAVQEARVEDYDIGFDYNRALALRPSRKTTLNFTTGSSIANDVSGRHFEATGSATLDHLYGRTGHVGLAYRRGVGFLEGLLAPVFTDSVTASAGNALSRRLRLAGSLGYVYGSVFGNVFGDPANSTETSRTGSNYGAWTGTGQFTVRLTARSSLQTGYMYYEHDVGDAVQLLGHLPNRSRRQTLFVGFTIGLPLISERVRTRR